MADEDQRDFSIDLARSLLRDADGNVVDVNDETALTQLIQEHRLDALVDSDQSGSEREVSVSESESGQEDVDRATVTTNSFEEVRDQLDELERAENFNCRCTILDGRPCCRQFTPAEIG